MPPANDRLHRAKVASRQLAQCLASDPAVTLVDVGLVSGPERVAIRVHVRPGVAHDALPVLPSDVDGIPVVLLKADYRFES